MRTLEEYLTDEMAAGQLLDFELVPRRLSGVVTFSIRSRSGEGETMEFRVVDNNLIPTACWAAHRSKVSRGTSSKPINS